MNKKKQINLIPIEMAVPAKAVILSKFLNKISTLFAFFLVLLTVFVIGTIFYLNSEYIKVNGNVSALKNKIVELEKNEQKLILAKDKLVKINAIRAIDSIDNELDSFLKFQDLVAPDSPKYGEINLGVSKTEVSLSFPNTGSLTSVLKKIDDKLDYSRVTIESLGYSTSNGYSSNLIFEE